MPRFVECVAYWDERLNPCIPQRYWYIPPVISAYIRPGSFRNNSVSFRFKIIVSQSSPLNLSNKVLVRTKRTEMCLHPQTKCHSKGELLGVIICQFFLMPGVAGTQRAAGGGTDLLSVKVQEWRVANTAPLLYGNKLILQQWLQLFSK